MKINGYYECSFEEWRVDDADDKLHVIRQYVEFGQLRKEVIYFRRGYK